MPSLQDIRKYVDYFVETKGFGTEMSAAEPSSWPVQVAKVIRGVERGPAVMIQGIMPRSGTVYAGELLRLHPELYAYPHQIWEFPALQMTAEIERLQKRFLELYTPNQGKFQHNDFLPLFGAALLAYLCGPVPVHQRVLVKMPNVQYLSHFFSMFPHEYLLVLMRDGRDVVHSTLRTWPKLNFVQVCLRWNRSARSIVSTLEQLKATQRAGYWLARYEDALLDPETFVQHACASFHLDQDAYPYERIAEVRVIGSSKLKENHGKLQWRHQIRPQDFQPVAYWKTWPAHRRLIFKMIAGRSLRALGYCEDMNW